MLICFETNRYESCATRVRGRNLTPLITTIGVFILLYYPSKSQLFEIKCVFKYQHLQMFRLKLNKIINFHSIEVVDRVSETQLQVGENLNNLI